MTTVTFFLNLFGATMLLLFAVRMVQTGIERSMGPSFRRIITARKDSLIQTAGAGLMLAIVLQSATAAALLTAGFTGTGLLTFSSGLAAVLGADLGSALVVQILSFRHDWLVPVLLGIGGYLFVKTSGRTQKQVGRILMGVALILISLRFLSEAAAPVRQSNFMPAMASYLEGDFTTAFIVGAVVTLVLHSSVAAILMMVTFVSVGVIPLQAGVSMVIGANLGSAALMIWLSRGMPNHVRSVLFGNFLPRGLGAVAALLVVNLTPVLGYLNGFPDGQILVATHILFNALLVIVALPCVGLIEVVLRAAIPDLKEGKGAGDDLRPLTALDRNVIENPKLAIAGVTREVLHMSETVEIMADPVMELYQSGDFDQIKTLQNLDRGVNNSLSDIRRYVASIPKTSMSKEEYRRTRDLTEYAINLETAGDIICKRLLPLAHTMGLKKLRFSDDGRKELERLHERVMANMRLAFNVVVSEDPESARLVMEEKAAMAIKERKSRKRHLKRLRAGSEDSFESSDIHLETLRGLKDLNSQIAAVAYPILFRRGQMRTSRLIDEAEVDEALDE